MFVRVCVFPGTLGSFTLSQKLPIRTTWLLVTMRPTSTPNSSGIDLSLLSAYLWIYNKFLYINLLCFIINLKFTSVDHEFPSLNSRENPEATGSRCLQQSSSQDPSPQQRFQRSQTPQHSPIASLWHSYHLKWLYTKSSHTSILGHTPKQQVGYHLPMSLAFPSVLAHQLPLVPV